MKDTIKKLRSQLEAGDIKAIANKTGISYQTVYKALTGTSTSRRQTEILKAVTDFLQERKNELERLESVLN